MRHLGLGLASMRHAGLGEEECKATIVNHLSDLESRSPEHGTRQCHEGMGNPKLPVHAGAGDGEGVAQDMQPGHGRCKQADIRTIAGWVQACGATGGSDCDLYIVQSDVCSESLNEI